MRDRDDGQLREVLDSIDIEAWMDREGMRYKSCMGSSGRQLNVKECPSCGNSKWKVYVGAESGLGNCFVCETKFTKWRLIKDFLGVDNGKVFAHIKSVAAEQGWRPPQLKAAPVPISAQLQLPASIALPVGTRNLRYLDNRGITGEITRYFGLRYSPDGHFEYKDYAGRTLRQDYSKRIIIPVFDLDGQLVSFQGRDITDQAEKKYLFPPGFASTGTHLYNGHNAIGAERITIGEGVFDVAATKIALDQDMALRDVVPVASFGKSLSSGKADSQFAKLSLLKDRGLKQVTFIWDGESKAIVAAIKAALEVHKIGLVARVAVLPRDKDPNEVAPDVVREAFYRARVVNPSTAVKLLLELSRSAKICHK